MSGGPDRIREQAIAIYREIGQVLYSRGDGLPSVIREVVFFRDIASDLDPFLEARLRGMQDAGAANAYQPVSTFIQQPPANPEAALEILVTAVTPRPGTDSSIWSLGDDAPLALCGSCAPTDAKAFLLGDEKHVYGGNIYGDPGSAYDETLSMMRNAARLLEEEGLDFRSVPRTWIYFRHMWRDYGGFNRARRDFFRERGVDLRPASTGIHGVPFPSGSNICMSFHAIGSRRPEPFEIMTTPTLNEAWEYGSEFSRGLRVRDANKTTLYVSGTASINEEGETVHLDDFDGQMGRTLLNIEQLLEHQRASFDDVVSAITYVKRREDIPRALERAAELGLDRFPHAMVEAGVCREDLLIETEVTAIVPQDHP